MNQALTWLANNPAGIAALGASIAFCFSIVRYVLDRNQEQKEKEFDAYHRLIKELVSPDAETKVIWIQRQMAAIFELRHFPRYYEVTISILNSLKKKWTSDPEMVWDCLLDEVEKTLRFISK